MAMKLTRKPKRITSSRGFFFYVFKDIYGAECSISESSLATKAAIWLGQGMCDKCKEPTRMHLDQKLAKHLIPLLQHFVDTGELP